MNDRYSKAQNMSSTRHENLKTAELSTPSLSCTKRLVFGGLLALFVLAIIEVIGQMAYFVGVGDWLMNRAVLPIYQQAATPGEAHELRPMVNFENRSPEFNIKLVTDAQGFRVAQPGEVTPLTKPDDEYRIMLFGPSFAFGAGVNYEDTWGKVLSDLLQEHTEENVRVINAGVPSLGDYHVLKRAQRLVPAYHPDLIVFINYFPGITKFPPDTLRCTSDGYLVPNEQYWVSYVKQSALVYWLFQIRSALGSSSSHEREFAAPERKLASWSDSPHYQPWQTNFISEFERLAKDNDARLVMAYAPAQFEVHEEYIDRWAHRHDFKGELLTHMKAFHTFMGQALEGREILYVDLLPGMLAAAAADRATKLYYYLDVHWNSAGNRVVAEILATAIRHAGLMER